MNNKRIYQIASLIMALVMIVGNNVHSQAAASVSAAAVSGPSIYWGALVNAAPSSVNLAPGGPINTFETLSKKKMAIDLLGGTGQCGTFECQSGTRWPDQHLRDPLEEEDGDHPLGRAMDAVRWELGRIPDDLFR